MFIESCNNNLEKLEFNIRNQKKKYFDQRETEIVCKVERLQDTLNWLDQFILKGCRGEFKNNFLQWFGYFFIIQERKIYEKK